MFLLWQVNHILFSQRVTAEIVFHHLLLFQNLFDVKLEVDTWKDNAEIYWKDTKEIQLKYDSSATTLWLNNKIPRRWWKDQFTNEKFIDLNLEIIFMVNKMTSGGPIINDNILTSAILVTYDVRKKRHKNSFSQWHS